MNRRGEISTIVVLGSLVVLTITTFVGNKLNQQQQSRDAQAAGQAIISGTVAGHVPGTQTSIVANISGQEVVVVQWIGGGGDFRWLTAESGKQYTIKARKIPSNQETQPLVVTAPASNIALSFGSGGGGGTTPPPSGTCPSSCFPYMAPQCSRSECQVPACNVSGKCGWYTGGGGPSSTPLPNTTNPPIPSTTQTGTNGCSRWGCGQGTGDRPYCCMNNTGPYCSTTPCGQTAPTIPAPTNTPIVNGGGGGGGSVTATNTPQPTRNPSTVRPTTYGTATPTPRSTSTPTPTNTLAPTNTPAASMNTSKRITSTIFNPDACKNKGYKEFENILIFSRGRTQGEPILEQPIILFSKQRFTTTDTLTNSHQFNLAGYPPGSRVTSTFVLYPDDAESSPLSIGFTENIHGNFQGKLFSLNCGNNNVVPSITPKSDILLISTIRLQGWVDSTCRPNHSGFWAGLRAQVPSGSSTHRLQRISDTNGNGVVIISKDVSFGETIRTDETIPLKIWADIYANRIALAVDKRTTNIDYVVQSDDFAERYDRATRTLTVNFGTLTCN